MNSDIRQLLEAVRAGETSVDDALLEIKKAPLPISDMPRWICTERSDRALQR